MKELVIRKFEELLLNERNELKNLMLSDEFRSDVSIAYLNLIFLPHDISDEEIRSWEQFERLRADKLELRFHQKAHTFYPNYKFPNFYKSEIMKYNISQYETMINKINKLEFLSCPQDLEKYLNPYGLFIDRQHTYFSNEFINLDDELKILVFVQEYVHAFAKTKHNCEGLLALSHLKLINGTLPYAQSKRSTLIDIYNEQYGEFKYIWQSSKDKIKYIKNLVKEKTLLESPSDENVYYKKSIKNGVECIEPLFLLITQNEGI